MALTDSLISFWELEETSGTRYDSHGSNDLADNNTVTSNTGKVGTAAEFVRVNAEYLSGAAGLNFSADPGFTFSMWVYYDTLPSSSNMSPIGKWASGDGGYGINLRHDGTNYKANVTVYDSTTPTENLSGDVGTWSPSVTTWYHVVWTFTESSYTSEVFIDASSIGTYTHTGYSGTLNDSAGDFHIGNYYLSETAYGWNGRIDQVGVWNRVLTGSEITELYNSGSGLSYADMTGGGATTPAPTLTILNAG